MFDASVPLNKYLRQYDHVHPIYAAMKSDDYSDVVMAAFNMLEKCVGFPRNPKVRKCEAKSDEYRNKGNALFKAGDCHKALECYNRALMNAPKNSRSMILAYSNRSAVLFHEKEFNSCIVDIEVCLRLGCPLDIVDKLTKRKSEAVAISKYENINLEDCYADFFRFDVERNTQIPCASTDIEVVIKDNAKKIVAAKDIKVGTLLALEPSFVGYNDKENMALSCHFCHKISMNLIPCESCCFVLFCDEKCKDLCFKEYHSIECQIMDDIVTTLFSSVTKLMVKGTLKFVKMCESWKEVISASQCIGSDRIRVCSVEEMFNVNNKLSVLSYNDDRLFVHGSIYLASFTCAIIIYYLEKVPSFLPRLLGERKLARQALGRLMIYFSIHAKPNIVCLSVSHRNTRTTYLNPFINHGWYPFIGKLQISCTPNAFVSYLYKKAALITLRPIEKGSELTINYITGYWHENLKLHKKNCLTFNLFGKVCDCTICNGDWKLQTNKFMLSEKQLDTYRNVMQDTVNNDIKSKRLLFPKLCEVLTCLNDMPFSNEYIKTFSEFRKCIITFEDCEAHNIVLSTIKPVSSGTAENV